MGAIATLEPKALGVDPGGEVSTTLKVRNAGTVVDEFTFEVLGAPAGWAVVDPAVLRLMPGTEEQARVILRPPRSSEVPAGALPFGIKIHSKEDPAGTIVEEGTVTVSPFGEVTAELLPRTARGRRRVRHELAVDNRGNDRLNADVLAFDENELLDFDVGDPALVIEPGTAAFTKVKVQPRKRFWRGPDKTMPFKVQLSSNGGPMVDVDGTMVQRAILPKGLGRALLLALAALLLLAILWFTLFKPTIAAAAREGVEEELAEQDTQISDMGDQLGALAETINQSLSAQQAQIEELRAALNEVRDLLGLDPLAGDGAPIPDTAGLETPFDIRLTASAGLNATSSGTPFEVGEGETLKVTDLVIQNPSGNQGRLFVERDTPDGRVTLLEVALENFRDLDYHFVSPVVVGAGESLVLRISCTGLTEPSTSCSAAAYVSGTLRTSG